ncbi:hypothetical protein BRC97_09930 [Halobacteriales archaeon QS_6_71_20]|nr:MAG: hypothetical protein BRC97_09930 [Halobacteriales archaeon QS_6_71_20]
MTEYDIIDFEMDEVVATVNEDGELQTDDEVVAEMVEELTEGGGITIMVPGGSGDTHAYGEWTITPEDTGFLVALDEYMPSPYRIDSDQLDDVEGYRPPEEAIPGEE